MFQVDRLYISVRHSSASLSSKYLWALGQGIGSDEGCMCVGGFILTIVLENSDCSSPTESFDDQPLDAVEPSNEDDILEVRDMFRKERSIS